MDHAPKEKRLRGSYSTHLLLRSLSIPNGLAVLSGLDEPDLGQRCAVRCTRIHLLWGSDSN